jgi:hypothetical protein
MHPDAQLTVDVIRARGWQAVLLAPRSKKPSGPAWMVTKDAATVAQWFDAGFNVGLICHEDTGLAVLDADDLVVWTEMVATLGELSPPWTLTGGGGLHFYVQWVAGLPAKLLWNGLTVGEVQRGPGQQQVVLPGSIHPDTGEVYRWNADPLSDYTTLALPPLPEDWRLYLQGYA